MIDSVHSVCYNTKPGTEEGRARESSLTKLTVFFFVLRYFLEFPSQYHTTHQVVVERRTCLYAKSPYGANNIVSHLTTFPGKMNEYMDCFVQTTIQFSKIAGKYMWIRIVLVMPPKNGSVTDYVQSKSKNLGHLQASHMVLGCFPANHFAFNCI